MKIFLTLPSDISNFSFQCILLPSYPVLQWHGLFLEAAAFGGFYLMTCSALIAFAITSPATISEEESGSMYPVIYILHITCVIIESYFWNHMHVCIDSMHLIFCCRWCSHRINNMSIFLLTLSDCKCSGNFKLTSFKNLHFTLYAQSMYGSDSKSIL